MRTAFTLIELLVVIAIIAVLAALLIPVLGTARWSSRATQTTARIDAVLQGLLQYGSANDGGPAYALQRAAGLPGVLRWQTHAVTLATTPLEGAWPDLAKPELLGLPWSRPAGTDPLYSAEPTADITLAQFQPRQSARLMALSGQVPGADPALTWSSDRGTARTWNDAWGHPLVVGWALFQPGEPVAARFPGGVIPKSWSPLRAASGAWRVNRIVYLAVLAPGPQPAGVPAGADWSDPETAAAAWSGGIGVLEGQGLIWNGAAWEQPPWKGIAIAKGRQRPFVSAPIEVK